MKNKYYFLLLMGVSLLTIFSIFSFTGVDTSVSKIIMSYGIGDNASDFKLKNVDGKTVSLSDYKQAKGFIVIFTCNTCPV